MAKGNLLRRLRQGLLLYLLIMVAWGTWLSRERATNWDNTLRIAVYPINGDQSETSANYIAALEPADFSNVEKFFTTHISSYGHQMTSPVLIDLRDELEELPPAPPAEPSALSVMSWSLKMRYWAWRMQRSQKSILPDIRLFVIYFDPQDNPRLAHSLGLQKGLLGVVNAYADKHNRGRNHLVMVHELMHALGATDKYDLQTTLPVYPDGFADPDAKPLYPQSSAEIMGGRIPLSASESEMPNTLRKVVVGPLTAREIRWLKD